MSDIEYLFATRLISHHLQVFFYLDRCEPKCISSTTTYMIGINLEYRFRSNFVHFIYTACSLQLLLAWPSITLKLLEILRSIFFIQFSLPCRYLS